MNPGLTGDGDYRCLVRGRDMDLQPHTIFGRTIGHVSRAMLYRYSNVRMEAKRRALNEIAGHVSRAMLSRYSNVRMEAKRCALDEIGARQRGAEQKSKEEDERQQAEVAPESVVVQ